MRLISERTALVAGETAYLGVTFEIDEGWHLYWNGRNDTGFPIDIDLKLPDGFEQLETLHPVPTRRYVSPGGILDHVYENSITLIVPVRVPASARTDTRVTISGTADWLVCKEACIPGSGEFSLELPVVSAGSGAEKSGDARLFAQARARVPKPIADVSDPPRVRWEGEQIVIESPSGGWIEFYPFERSASIKDPIGSQTSNDGVLRLTTDAASSGKSFAGVVAWKVRDRETDGWIQRQAVVRIEPEEKPGS